MTGLFTSFVSCQRTPASDGAAQSQSISAPVTERTIELAIGGMSCDSCTPAVKGVLKKVEGVRQVEVNFAEKKAIVVYDPARTAPEALVHAVNGTRIFSATLAPPAARKP